MLKRVLWNSSASLCSALMGIAAWCGIILGTGLIGRTLDPWMRSLPSSLRNAIEVCVVVMAVLLASAAGIAVGIRLWRTLAR